MREFDLAAAKAGAPVCTRGGREARIICFDRSGNLYPIVCLLKSENGNEYMEMFTINGRKCFAGEGSGDLVMRDDDYAEKLARGEYGDHIADVRKKVSPTCKESLPVDREYWRRVYAGQIMSVVLHAAITTGAKVKDKYKDMPTDVAAARSAIILADVLIEELEKTEK